MDKNTPPQDEQQNQSETLAFIDFLRSSLPIQDEATQSYFDREFLKTKRNISYMRSDKVIEGALNHLDRKINSYVKFITVDFNAEMLLAIEKLASLFDSKIDIFTQALMENPKYSSSRGLNREDKSLFRSVDAVRQTGKYNMKHILQCIKIDLRRTTNKTFVNHIMREIKGRNDDETSMQFTIYLINLYHTDIYVKKLHKLRENFLAGEQTPPMQDMDEKVSKLLSSLTGFKITWNNELAALAYLFKQLKERDADKYDPKHPKTALEATNDELIAFICKNFTHRGQPIKPSAISDYFKKHKVPSKPKNIIDVDKLFEGL